jgi:sec-independent protein translocase protein TatA
MMTPFGFTGIAWIGWHEVLIILVVALLLFGARKLPELARSLARALRGFQDEMHKGGGEGGAADTSDEESETSQDETKPSKP